ncbi:hypothetical protein ABVT39_017802, partial [Epinephelus coioides]
MAAVLLLGSTFYTASNSRDSSVPSTGLCRHISLSTAHLTRDTSSRHTRLRQAEEDNL